MSGVISSGRGLGFSKGRLQGSKMGIFRMNVLEIELKVIKDLQITE